MAQMTEKRTTSARSGTAAKENHSLTGRNNNQAHQRSGKGIEILDFHESWLEEVEIYKDKMVMCKKLAHHNHVPASAHHLQPHLAAPNRNQGRVIQSGAPQHRSSAGGGSTSGAGASVASVSASARSSPPKQRSPPSPRKRLTPEKVAALGGGGGASKVAGQRIVIRGSPPNNSPPKVASMASSASPIVANSVLQSEPYKKVQVSGIDLSISK